MNVKHKKIKIFDTEISSISFNDLVNYLASHKIESNYICLTDLIVLSKSFENNQLKAVLNKSLFNLPDGKFLEMVGKLKGERKMKTISGYWLLMELLKTNRKHFFYGSNNLKLTKIKNVINKNNPSANVLGFKSPPFVQLDNIIDNDQFQKDMVEINDLHPDIIWVGLGGGKQDLFMNCYYKSVDNAIMIGIGAVFDYVSGDVKQSPEWIKKIYLRWLYRLIFSYDKKRNMILLNAIKTIIFTFLSKMFSKVRC